jgi:hypothetical protein
MIKLLARFWARRSYIWKIEKKAGEDELNAKLSALHAEQKRQEAEALNAEADAIEKSVKEFAENEEKGFWRCEDEHESEQEPERKVLPQNYNGEISDDNLVTPACACGKAAKFIKRSEMTGQEKYESDKERGDAEQMAKNRREKAAALAKEVSQLEGTAQHFRREADRSHLVAQEIKSV